MTVCSERYSTIGLAVVNGAAQEQPVGPQYVRRRAGDVAQAGKPGDTWVFFCVGFFAISKLWLLSTSINDINVSSQEVCDVITNYISIDPQ